MILVRRAVPRKAMIINQPPNGGLVPCVALILIPNTSNGLQAFADRLLGNLHQGALLCTAGWCTVMRSAWSMCRGWSSWPGVEAGERVVSGLSRWLCSAHYIEPLDSSSQGTYHLVCTPALQGTRPL